MATIVEQYIQKHPKSAERYQRARDLFPGGVTHDTRYLAPFPIYMTHGAGPRKWDVDGNEYVDYVCGHGALILGHSHPAIVKVVSEQIARGTHLGGNTDEELRWGEAIRALIPSAEKVRFHSSGTEATLMAMRLARAYTGKPRIVKFADHFHGWHDYAMPGLGRSMSGIPEDASATVTVLEPGDVALVERTIIEKGDVAAVILEPTGAHMGALPVSVAFLQGVREVTRKHGVVLIFDEVVTGFRTSRNGAQGRLGVTPDLTTLAKILAGGLPGGAVAGRRDILDMIQHRGDPEWDGRKRVSHPGTFNANPLSAAAGATCLELLASQPINEQAERMAVRLRQGINETLRRLEVPGAAYGIGAIVNIALGVPLRSPEEAETAPHETLKQAVRPQVTNAFKRAMLNEGVDTMNGYILLVSGVHQDRDVDHTLEAVERSLRAMRSEGVV